VIRVKEAVIVEGKYDKIRLSSVIDGLILETNGFRIFKDRGRMELLRRLAAERGLLVLTDSDSAGFVIRNYLSGCIPPEQIRHAYIPDLYGKEKRKRQPSKEGKLGVEGVSPEIIEQALRRAGIGEEAPAAPEPAPVTKTDLYLAGLSGTPQSAGRRAELLRHLGLPEHLSANSLPGVLSALMSREDFFALAGRLFTPQESGCQKP
jgi:ribonuclease M5